MTTKEIKSNIYWVGVKDWNRRLFDALVPLPQGTTYNSYLIKGDEKTILIDTVNPGFENELKNNINEITKLKELDYVVMNHAEPDHAGALPYVFKENKKAILLTTNQGAKFASIFYHIPEGRIKIVKDQETISIGNKTLQFIEAPFLHWPETMFTYLIEDKILFPCDFFGAHTAFGFYDEDNEELIPYAQRYYGEIMMPFSHMGKKALEKMKNLKIEMIAPSHGPIYKNPEKIIKRYKKWTAGETKEKVIAVYATMWKSTEKMIKTIVDTLIDENIEVACYNLSTADIGEVAKDLVDSRAIVLGTPTVLGGMHPIALYGTYLVKILRPPLKYGVILTSYGWGATAVKHIIKTLSPTKIELVGTLEINGPPTERDKEKIKKIGRKLAKKVKESSK